MTTTHHELVAELDADQRKAVLDPAEQLLIVAGAGSGKTRAFVHRIARMVADGAEPESILALSYTNAAANEVTKRLALMGIEGVQAMTLHAWCHRQPMRLFSAVIGKTGYRILDGDGSDEVLRYDMRLGEYGAQAARTELTEAKNMLSDLYDENKVEAYNQILASRGQLDFDDLQVGALRILQESPEALVHYRNTLRHVLIDEYQDVNPVQHEILRLLCLPDEKMATPSLTVVGDPDQAIYGFRGADDTFIKEFTSEFEGSSEVRLLRNYRSTAEILQAADDIVGDNPERLVKRMESVQGPGLPIEVCDAPTDVEEADLALSRVSDWLEDGVEPQEIAVLYRYHNQLDRVFDLFREHGVPTWAPYIDDGEQGKRVAVRSVHSAKGLEYDRVILIGWNDGSMPTWRVNKTPQLIEEERRIAYVAITRAREQVLITYPQARELRSGSWVSQNPSRFLSRVSAAAITGIS